MSIEKLPKDSNRVGDWMQVWPSAGKFWPLDPRPEEISLEDIVWSLSLGTRYAGHVRRRYSVLEHSVRVCWYLQESCFSDAVQYQGLMHDTPEAYLIDVPSPIKRSIDGYSEIEEKLWLCICEKFKIEPTINYLVKYWDKRICLMEKKHLCPSNHKWGITGVPPKASFVGWLPPFVWRFLFMREFKRLAPISVRPVSMWANAAKVQAHKVRYFY